MAGKKKGKASPFARSLASIARAVAKARPTKLHVELYAAFRVFAAAGDVARAGTVVEWMYGGRTPVPERCYNVFAASAIDGFCAAAGLGDRTGGVPRHEEMCPVDGPLADRVEAARRAVRARLTLDAYGGGRGGGEGRWRAIDRWRRAQSLAARGKDQEALALLGEILDELAPDARGAGYGDELVLALDLALENGADDRVAGWLERHGHRLASEAFLIDAALCLPAVAERIAEGLFGGAIGLGDAERGQALAALDEALSAAPPAVVKTPKVQRRRVGAEYSQVHLGPRSLDASEREQVHFQKKGDSARGLSLFPTMVGIGTPADTDYVDAEITLARDPGRVADDAVQAVAFPIAVRGPLVLSSATSGEDDAEPLVVPPGSYDALAQFVPKKAPRPSASAGLRVFKLLLSFHPVGSLEAPRTIRMERA